MSQDMDADAILLDVEKDTSKSFNAVLGATIAFCIVFLIISATINNNVSAVVDNENGSSDAYVSLYDRYLEDYVTDGEHGQVLENGTYTLLETANEWNSTHHFVEYELPLEEGGAAPNGLISLAVWRPDVEDGVKVPIIAEIGPYFQEPSVQTPTIEVPGSWLGTMIIDQILPHGYAFAQISV